MLHDRSASRPTSRHGYPKWFAHFPFAPWGFRELNLLGWPLLALVIGFVWLGGGWQWLAIVPGALLVLVVYFFRDPPRRIPEAADAIVAPADGTIVEVTPLEHDDFLAGPAVRIGIFLSIFNVHINRAPLAGRVLQTHYQPGEFLNALNPDSALRNESMWIGFETTAVPTRRFAVRQISGLIARRIVCLLEPGQAVARGEKFGMIKLGSRTELLLPRDAAEVVVRPGDKVRAGSRIVAYWKSDKTHEPTHVADP
jgi:phosphatidylserine decarboxylase